jgi:hypothetical protein
MNKVRMVNVTLALIVLVDHHHPSLTAISHRLDSELRTIIHQIMSQIYAKGREFSKGGHSSERSVSH